MGPILIHCKLVYIERTNAGKLVFGNSEFKFHSQKCRKCRKIDQTKELFLLQKAECG